MVYYMSLAKFRKIVKGPKKPPTVPSDNSQPKDNKDPKES
jgi:hypothetical protein